MPASEHMRSCALIVLEGNGRRAAWGGCCWCIVLQHAQVPALPCAGRARMDGQLWNQGAQQCLLGQGTGARGLAGRTVDRETPLQSWVEPQRLACLTEWTVVVVPVGGGRGVQAYAVLGVIRVWMYLAGSNQIMHAFRTVE